MEHLGRTQSGMHTALAKITQELHKLQAQLANLATSGPDLVTSPVGASAAVVLEDNAAAAIAPVPVTTANINDLLVNPGKASKPGHALPTLAGEFYVHCMSKGGSVPSMPSKSLYKAEICFTWFDAMATEAEKGRLKARAPVADAERKRQEDGDKRRIGAKLNDLIVARFVDLFKSTGKGEAAVPKGLRNPSKGPSTLPVSAVESRVSGLRKQLGLFVHPPDPEELQQWRQEYEKRGTAKPSPKRQRNH